MIIFTLPETPCLCAIRMNISPKISPEYDPSPGMKFNIGSRPNLNCVPGILNLDSRSSAYFLSEARRSCFGLEVFIWFDSSAPHYAYEFLNLVIPPHFLVFYFIWFGKIINRKNCVFANFIDMNGKFKKLIILTIFPLICY